MVRVGHGGRTGFNFVLIGDKLAIRIGHPLGIIPRGGTVEFPHWPILVPRGIVDGSGGIECGKIS